MSIFHVLHARLAVLEKRKAWLPRLCYWLRSREGKGETGEGTVEGSASVGKELPETLLIERCPRWHEKLRRRPTANQERTDGKPSCLYSVWKTNWNLESIKIIIKKCFTSVHQVHLCIDWDACVFQLFLLFRHKEKWQPFARGSNPRGDTPDFNWPQEPHPVTGMIGGFFGGGKILASIFWG